MEKQNVIQTTGIYEENDNREKILYACLIYFSDRQKTGTIAVTTTSTVSWTFFHNYVILYVTVHLQYMDNEANHEFLTNLANSLVTKDISRCPNAFFF